MPAFTATALAIAGAIGVTSGVFVSAYTKPSMEFDPAHKEAQK